MLQKKDISDERTEQDKQQISQWLLLKENNEKQRSNISNITFNHFNYYLIIHITVYHRNS